ncbi:MAG: transcriptional repressor [Clostridiales bacterium]|jgi:Fur family ferric uptake transcriptional regulator|nr:transcriptional repressor [Clostridiales bacterium]
MKKKEYATKQREAVLEYMTANKDCHFTAESLYEYLKGVGSPVGLTTVYRTLEKLVREGVAEKCGLQDGMPACYEYVCGTPRSHIVCTRCGKIAHLECGQIDAFADHISDAHSFGLDKSKTVFYGVCGKCR